MNNAINDIPSTIIANTADTTTITTRIMKCQEILNLIKDKIMWYLQFIIDGVNERVEIYKLFEFSSLEFEKEETIATIKKGNFLTFLLFITVLVLLIVIDKKYGLVSKKRKKVVAKSNINNEVISPRHFSLHHYRKSHKPRQRSIGSSNEMKLNITDLDIFKKNRDNLLQLQEANSVGGNSSKNKLKKSQSSLAVSSSFISNNISNNNHNNNNHNNNSGISKDNSNNINNRDLNNNNYNNIEKYDEQIKVGKSKTRNRKVRRQIEETNELSTSDYELLAKDKSNDQSMSSQLGRELYNSTNSSNLYGSDSNISTMSEEFKLEESRRRVMQDIKENARIKLRALILNSPLLEEVYKKKKENQPPQFKRIRPSKKNSYSYQSSSLFNQINGNANSNSDNSIINNNIINNNIINNNNIIDISNNNNSNNSINNNNNSGLPFFGAKIDATNYVPTQTYGYNYKDTTVSPSSTSNNPPSPNHRFVDITVEYKEDPVLVQPSPSPSPQPQQTILQSLTPPTTTLNGNTISERLLLSVDEFLDKKTKEEKDLLNGVNNNGNSSSSNNNTLVPPSFGFGNIRISDHSHKLPSNSNSNSNSNVNSPTFQSPSHSPLQLTPSLKPKDRSKLLMSNYDEDYSKKVIVNRQDNNNSSISNISNNNSNISNNINHNSGNNINNSNNNSPYTNLPNISLRFASKGISITPTNQSNSDNERNENENNFNNDYEQHVADDEKEDSDIDSGSKNQNNNIDYEHDKIDQLYREKSNNNLSTLINNSDNNNNNSSANKTIATTMKLNNSIDINNITVDTINSNGLSHKFEFDSVKNNANISFADEEEDYCDSDIDGEDFSSANIDYNERFQEIMEDLRNIDCNSLQSDKIKVNSQFIALTQDFVYASSTFGKVIISERYLPNSEKTIPSIDIGGIAGGDKFIVHGILFKFAIDRENFYGSDYASMCVSNHELKGLINVFNCNVSNLCLPLMALVDYRGFRLIAMSILPVFKDSICYGSNDYGLTIHNSDEFLSSKVKEVANALNIKSHNCGDKGTYLHSPADLEGHRGFDGRYYLLDFARLFAAEAPRKDIKMGHLYRLLRPEFVKNYKKPLCSDSFSRFIRGHNEEEHNSETVEATSYLLNTTIPELAEELNGFDINIQNVYTFPITECLHRSGVNVRYLGCVRQLCNSLDMKSLIFIEMCARVVKQQLRQKLRFKMKQAKIPLEAPYRRLIVAYLNRILGISDKSDLFWNERMKKYLIKKFDKALFEDEIKGNSLILGLSSFSDHLIDGKYLLFRRIQKMTGLKFTNRINEEFRSQPNCWLLRGENPLDINDLDEIGIRVKYVPFMNVAQGYLFKVKGEMLFASDPIAANRFFHMALDKLETALETDPNNPNTLCTMGEVYSHLGVGDMQGVSEIQFTDRNNPDIDKAFEYFQRAIFSNPNHTDSLFRFAQLLERCGDYNSAEEYYLSSLKTNPNNIVCLQEYGNFLQSARNDFTTAELFFYRGSQNHQYLHKLREQQQNPINIRGSSGLLKVKYSNSSSSSNNILSQFNSINNSNSSNNNNTNGNNNSNNNNMNYNYSSSNISTSSNTSGTSSTTSSHNSTSLNNNSNIRGSGSNLFNNNSDIRGSGGNIRLTPPFMALSSGIDLTPIRDREYIRRSTGSSTPGSSPRGNTPKSGFNHNSPSLNYSNSANNSDNEFTDLSSSPKKK